MPPTATKATAIHPQSEMPRWILRAAPPCGAFVYKMLQEGMEAQLQAGANAYRSSNYTCGGNTLTAVHL